MQLMDTTRPGSWGLLIRHAEREEILDGDSYIVAQLTDAGRAAARKLGNELAAIPLAKVLSSPVPRCVDTGVNILVGAGVHMDDAQRSVQTEMRLASAFVSDRDLVKQTFSSGPPEETILELLDGASLPGLHSVAQGSRVLLDLMLSHMTPGKLTIFVSHDALIMPFTQHHCGRSFTMTDWLGFLDGALVYAPHPEHETDVAPRITPLHPLSAPERSV